MKIRVLLLALTIFLGACASQQDKDLVEAAGDGDVERVQRLLDRGADVNTVALEWTPLTNAARKGQLGAVELLVASGADVNKGIAGLSPLFFAARRARGSRPFFIAEECQVDLSGGSSEEVFGRGAEL
jgi:ankyrin repeat protein